MAALTPAASAMTKVKRSMVYECRRCLHTTAPRQGSPFFALAALSNSRETNHISKLSKLSRVQHSPTLQLIQSSEVFPFASPAPPPPQSPTSTPIAAPAQAAVEAQKQKFSEAQLLSLGRAILAEKNAELSKLREELEEEKDRSTKREASYTLARQRSRERIHSLNEDVSSARTWKWIFLLIGGSVAAYSYGYDSVKKAWGITITQDPVRHKTVPAAAAAAAPAVPQRATPVVVEKPVSAVPAVSTPAVQAAPVEQKSTSWPSIFWR